MKKEYTSYEKEILTRLNRVPKTNEDFLYEVINTAVFLLKQNKRLIVRQENENIETINITKI